VSGDCREGVIGGDWTRYFVALTTDPHQVAFTATPAAFASGETSAAAGAVMIAERPALLKGCPRMLYARASSGVVWFRSPSSQVADRYRC
jgi:hypothetical protein